ncbi:type I secretion system protein LssZ [Legionella impletisoli]|uniref:Type I secretion system LssZ n=1 Tax=Legionella impletisoli TaxID=343510 RepID=A0A917JLW1_9GAMM|nr:type I secretion system protein LssZ [Legionella impletisoli]GGI75984.1 type I secretion system LssZ [Legionella impletisoli]
MNIILNTISYLLPLLALILLLVGMFKKRKRFVLASLLVSLIGILLQYETAGGEIFGLYFNYKNALIYTLSFLILMIALIYIGIASKEMRGRFRYPTLFLFMVLFFASSIILVNVWINAWFIEHTLKDTTVIQVATFKKNEFCAHDYLFYKVSPDGKMQYLCPNHYVLIAKTGRLDLHPELFIQQYLAGQTPYGWFKDQNNNRPN